VAPARGRSASPLAATMRYVAALLVAMSCSSCDIFYGVFHSAQDVSPVPSDLCVVNAITTIPGITNVSSRVDAGSRPLTLHGVEKPDEVHRFFYEYHGIHSSFFISVSYQGRANYFHDFIEINRKPPQDVIDQLHPVFNEVDRALQSQCGMTNLALKVHETCRGVRCGGG
jgi:hypothetical protein